jgi:hypothetical protein
MFKRGAQRHLKPGILSSNLRQQAKVRRPVGFSAVRRLAKARVGSAKNNAKARKKEIESGASNQ